MFRQQHSCTHRASETLNLLIRHKLLLKYVLGRHNHISNMCLRVLENIKENHLFVGSTEQSFELFY